VNNLGLVGDEIPLAARIIHVANAYDSMCTNRTYQPPRSGSDALAVINTISGMAIDHKTRRPVIGNVQGGVSGPAIKPIALLMVRKVYEVAGPKKIPIIGQGGITTVNDALEFLIAGAAAVGIGTALFYQPLILKTLNAGIEAAKAGEFGKGFAVVAREMRSLADQSIQSTARIRDILSEIRAAIRATVAITDDATGFAAITSAVERGNIVYDVEVWRMHPADGS